MLIKGPEHKRAWLVPVPEGDPTGASARFVEEDPALGLDTLRRALNLPAGELLPTQIEIAVSKLYWTRLRIQGYWK